MIDQHQWGFGTSNLMGHGCTEPEIEILKLVRGLRNRLHSLDVGTRVGGRKGFDDGNGRIGGKALVVNHQLRAEEDTHGVGLFGGGSSLGTR